MINLDLFLKIVDARNGITIYKEASRCNCWEKYSFKEQEGEFLEVVYAEIDVLAVGDYEIYVKENKEEDFSEEITVRDFINIQEHNEHIVLYFEKNGKIKPSGKEYHNFLSYEEEAYLSDYNDNKVEKIIVKYDEIELIIKID